MQKRIDQFDIAKGIGILLVALGHNHAFIKDIEHGHTVIYLFHMPLFFFLSGLTASTVPTREKLLKKLRGLYKPYIVSSLLFLPRQLSIPDHPSNSHLALKLLWGSGNAIYNTPAWFLVALASGFVLYTLIQYVRERQGWEHRFPLVAVAMILLTYWGLSTQVGFGHLPKDELSRPLGAPFNLDLMPLVAGTLLLGNWWSKNETWTQTQSLDLFIFTIFFIGAFVGLFQFDPAMDLNYRNVQCWGVALMCTFLGVMAVLSTATLLARHTHTVKAVFIFIGQNTLIILLFHAAIQGALTRALPPSLKDIILLDAAVSVVVCFGLACLSEYVINRFAYLRLAFYAK